MKRRATSIHANYRPSPALTGKSLMRASSSSSPMSRMEMNPANIGTVSLLYRHTTGSCSSTLPLFSRNSREPGAAVPSHASISSTLYLHPQSQSERPLGSTNGLACLNPRLAISAETLNFGVSAPQRSPNSANEFTRVSQIAGAAQHGIC